MSIHEYVFYIHGVVADRLGGSHEKIYDELHQGISKCLKGEPWPTLEGGAEWGWRKNNTEPIKHWRLAEAQNVFGEKVLEQVRKAVDLTLNPSRLAVDAIRPTMMHGFGDIFYYVSTEGKWAVRNTVLSQLRQYIECNCSKESNNKISLTLIGHSAGSVIAFDLLHYIFMDEDKINNIFAKTEKGSESDVNEFKRNLKYFHKIKDGSFRLRMLVTLGSPISMLMYRSHKLIDTLASGDCLNPEHYGLDSVVKEYPLKLDTPRWINIWDQDDPISWPISPVMDHHRLVMDQYVDVSDKIGKAHNEYWKHKKVHQAIAKYWKELGQ